MRPHLPPSALAALLSTLAALPACAPETDPAADDPCAIPEEAPQGTICLVAGREGFAKLSDDGLPARQSELYLPIDMTVGPDGLLYLIDWNNHRIRRREADGTLTTLAGTGFLGDGPPGPALGASFNHPTNLKFDPNDDQMIYIAAWHNSRIEKLDLRDGTIHFECGNGDRAYAGDGGPAADAVFDLPSSIEFDDDGTIYVSDTANQIVRQISTDGMIHTMAGTPPPGLLPNGQTDRRYGWEGDGGDALAAKFNFGWGQRGYPGGRIERHDRKLYLADTYNFVVRVLDLDTMRIDHVAGVGLVQGYEGEGSPAATAKLGFPADLATDDDGNLYIADTFNH
ncbi:MAG TPA: hypothetical protein PKA64_05120, partial [Myxococcota bacterium]|nr:hypothetical protein [Myxococcota bacterium]